MRTQLKEEKLQTCCLASRVKLKNVVEMWLRWNGGGISWCGEVDVCVDGRSGMSVGDDDDDVWNVVCVRTEVKVVTKKARFNVKVIGIGKRHQWWK